MFALQKQLSPVRNLKLPPLSRWYLRLSELLLSV